MFGPLLINSAIMYIILLSQSLSDMQIYIKLQIIFNSKITTYVRLLDICSDFAVDYDLKFNINKSVIMRVGKRFNVKCNSLILSGNELRSVTCINYLGIHILAAERFKFDYSIMKSKLYQTFNMIFSKSKNSNTELVTVELFQSYCLSIILYATEVCLPSSSTVNKLDKCINVII